MGRFSDTLELHRLPESMAPVSSQSPQASHTTLERILDAICHAPVDGPFEDTMQWLLASFAEILPGYSLGLYVAESDGARPFVLRLPPANAPASGPSKDRRLMFPELPHELVLPLSSRPAPSSLHCASHDADLDSPKSPVTGVIRWCSEATDAVIRHTDRVRAARELAAETIRLRESLAQSDKLASLGQLSAGLVHEMSNPLTSIVVYADYLKRKMLTQGAEPDDIERVQRITEAADALLGFTRALKSYARPSNETAAVVDLRGVLDQSLSFCSHAIDACDVQIRRLEDDDVPTVMGVAAQLTQVFVNLITNACEALRPDGGLVTLGLSAGPARSSLIVTVSDSGHGIAAEDIAHIFEPFFTTREATAGTGLGLAIVRQIVEKHGGSVSVQSAPGDGCTFTVVLPAVPDPALFP